MCGQTVVPTKALAQCGPQLPNIGCSQYLLGCATPALTFAQSSEDASCLRARNNRERTVVAGTLRIRLASCAVYSWIPQSRSTERCRADNWETFRNRAIFLSFRAKACSGSNCGSRLVSRVSWPSPTVGPGDTFAGAIFRLRRIEIASLTSIRQSQVRKDASCLKLFRWQYASSKQF